MGTRDTVIVVYSRVGWERLTFLIGSILSPREQKIVVETINESDDHKMDPRGAHLLHWDGCNSSNDRMSLILDHLNGRIDSREWFVHILTETGDTDSYGSYYNNSFSPSIKRQLTWDDNNTMKAPHVSIAAAKPQTSTAPPVAVNNHVCPTCGNTACSRSESKCWKCGNPL